jgi:rare lipoprotein A
MITPPLPAMPEPAGLAATSTPAPGNRPDAAAEATPPAMTPPADSVTTLPVVNSPKSPAEYQRGQASWYGPRFHGRRTANGERFDMGAMTAAHKTLPFGTRLRVRSLVTGQEVHVRVNDRGPFIRGRIIDLSRSAARALGLLETGVKEVQIFVLSDEVGLGGVRLVE